MHTPAELCDCLRDLGIDRIPRTLTEWRRKGLLPPLHSESAGRGRGVKRFWSEDVLDQAIATDWLITDSDRADEALFGLWLSGYAVDPTAARQAWIQHLKRVQRQQTKAASRYSGRYFSLVGRWWPKLLRKKAFEMPWWLERSKSDRELIRDFLGATQEWLRDDDERDDEAYRIHLSELIVLVTKANRISVYAEVEKVWKLFDPASLFSITAYIEFVESLSVQEMNAAQESLAYVASALQHFLGIASPLDRVNRVILPLRLMRDLLGTFIARTVIMVSGAESESPIQQTISSVHDFAIRVQSTDIYHKNDGTIEFSDRVRDEWETTKKHLSQLWMASLKQIPN